MSIVKKQLVTRRVEDATAEKAIMYFDGLFATSEHFPEFSKDRCFCDFLMGEQGMLNKPDWEDWQWEAPHDTFKVWPCRVGVWHDKSVVDVQYDMDAEAYKVLPPLLEEGEDFDTLYLD
jgi:hypothetical protein|nr:MAG TPA: hypothetical protein [Caudoviricetes sp.]